MRKYILVFGACTAVLASELFSEEKLNLDTTDASAKSKEVAQSFSQKINENQKKKEEEPKKPSPFAFLNIFNRQSANKSETKTSFKGPEATGKVDGKSSSEKDSKDKKDKKDAKDQPKDKAIKTKTVTITEVRIVTVYKPLAPKPTDTPLKSSLLQTPIKLVKIGKDKGSEDIKKISEGVLKNNEKTLTMLKKQRKEAAVKLASLEKDLAKIDKTIEIAEKEKKIHEGVIKEKETSLTKTKKEFKSKEKDAEKKINTLKEKVEKGKETIDKNKIQKESLKGSIEMAKKQTKNLEKTEKTVEGFVASNIKDVISDLSKEDKEKGKELKKEKKKEEGEEKDLSKEKREKDKLKKEKKEKETEIKDLAKKNELLFKKKTSLKTTHRRGLFLSETFDSKVKDTTKKTEKAEKAKNSQSTTGNNPLTSEKQEKPSIPLPFPSSISNGHLVVTGSPITKDKESAQKAAKLFDGTLDTASKKAKSGEKVLAFWGYITSLLAESHQ